MAARVVERAGQVRLQFAHCSSENRISSPFTATPALLTTMSSLP
jgi:hypothetical protein